MAPTTMFSTSLFSYSFTSFFVFLTLPELTALPSVVEEEYCGSGCLVFDLVLLPFLDLGFLNPPTGLFEVSMPMSSQPWFPARETPERILLLETSLWPEQ